MATEYAEILSEVEDYLRSLERMIGTGDNKPAPQGAIPTPWMFLPAAPKDSFNEVYPGIVLGDYKISKDKPELSRLGITHLVNCAQGTKYNQINTDQEYFSDVSICFHGIAAVDTMGFKMTPFLEPAADFIQNAFDNQGKVYVHCQSGVSRSATVVLSYLMIKHNMRLIDALKTVRDKRAVQPNKGFLKQLCELDVKLINQR